MALPGPPPEARPDRLRWGVGGAPFRVGRVALLRFGRPPPEIATWLGWAHSAGQMLALFEVLPPFSVFVSFNGRRVWDWNRAAWAVLAAATLGLLLARG